MKLTQGLLLAAFSMGMASTAMADGDCDSITGLTEVLVTNDIAVSTTWTCDKTYNLQNQIYVLPGATLTIEAGTVIASTPTANGSGALAVTQGAQIFVLGTKDCPVIMTSTNDTATWVGGDPKSGTWREAANEWGNLTIMGSGYISEDVPNTGSANMPTCDPNNKAQMEGLTPAFPGDPNTVYGGGDDEDDSGVIEYLSLRYGGRVVGLANELNGLSLGGIGSGTTIDHVEIMNNVDDGIEIWGGCVDLKHLSIWNIGDDSLDIDQGYRGRIQFVLIVQGWSLDASQGSGVGDNIFETDGAENSDWQPVTTTTIYNFTAIGQPFGGDGAFAFRDNARVQYRNGIVTKCGEQIVRFDNVDGDGGLGYGHNGTLDWPTTWTTAWNAVPAHANDCPPGTYKAQFSGNLIEITDSVFYSNTNASAYTEFNARGANNPANNNVIEPSSSPITRITRGPIVVKGGLAMQPVTSLDPRPAADALLSVDAAPNNGFYTPAPYRGAFVPNIPGTWLGKWTASYAFGFTAQDPGNRVGFPLCFGDGTGNDCGCGANFGNTGEGCLNSTGTHGAVLVAGGNASFSSDSFQLSVSGVPGSKPGIVIKGSNLLGNPAGNGNPVLAGLLCTGPQIRSQVIQTNASGEATMTNWRGVPFSQFLGGGGAANMGAPTYYQWWYRDPMGPCADSNFSNAWCVQWNQ